MTNMSPSPLLFISLEQQTDTDFPGFLAHKTHGILTLLILLDFKEQWLYDGS